MCIFPISPGHYYILNKKILIIFSKLHERKLIFNGGYATCAVHNQYYFPFYANCIKSWCFPAKQARKVCFGTFVGFMAKHEKLLKLSFITPRLKKSISQ